MHGAKGGIHGTSVRTVEIEDISPPSADTIQAAVWTTFGRMYVYVIPDRQPGKNPSPTVVSRVSRPILDWYGIISRYPWPVEQVISVIYHTPNCPHGESGGDPSVVNGPNEGLLQINVNAHANLLRPGESLFDPEVNIRVGYAIWKDQGWHPWSCRP